MRQIGIAGLNNNIHCKGIQHLNQKAKNMGVNKKLSASICCPHETYSKYEDTNRLKAKSWKTICHAVAILISDSTLQDEEYGWSISVSFASADSTNCR